MGWSFWQKHSLRSLSSASFIASSSVASPPASDSALSLKFHYLLFSIKSFSSCLRRIPRLLVPSIFPSITRFIWQFLRKMWPIHIAFRLFILCRFLESHILYFSILSRDWTNCFPSLSSTKFRNFSGISHLLFEVSKFHHHKRLCSKCSTSLLSSFNLNPICWWKSLHVSECSFCRFVFQALALLDC